MPGAGGTVIKPSSFIMSAVMFFVPAGFLLLIPDQTLVFTTTKWGPVGPKQFAAVAFILGLLSPGFLGALALFGTSRRKVRSP